MKPGKTWRLINIQPLTPRFGSPSIKFKIIFQKNFQPLFTLHRYYLSSFK